MAVRPGPFHPGEQALQATVGMRERMALLGAKIIREEMPDQHRELFEKLPTLFVGALDAEGQPWATVVHGEPGFIQTPDARTLRVAAIPDAHDPAASGIRPGALVGLLGIEPHTRRRNRANGVVTSVEPDAWAVHVQQSYGNCPKYIHGRRPSVVVRVPTAAQREHSQLSAHARALIERSDTMFIASSSGPTVDAESNEPGAGVDVSHRGGPSGFIAIARGDADELTIPDYVGNAMFNTLGNLLAWPRAGLLFIDWQDGHLLHLAVTAKVMEARGGALTRFPCAERLVHLTVRHGWLRPFALPLTWTAPEAPPQLRARVTPQR